MNTSGHGNDGLISFVPLGVAVSVGVILLGGTANAMEAIDAFVREVVYTAANLINTLF
jgi:hypothetical protein